MPVGAAGARSAGPPALARLLVLALPAWAFVVAASLWLDGAKALLALPDPDDAMRLVEVRDLLAGQGWYDLVQHRLNPPDGVAMHWSRLVDAPIAAMILLLGPFLGPETAERWAVLLWPLVPALPLIAAAGAVGGRLAGRAGTVLALAGAALTVPLVRLFVPGRIDHHNVQMALAMVLIAALVWMPRRAAAVAAGVASALSLAVGLETAPYVALGGLAVMAGWWAEGPARTPAAITYLAAFAVVATLAMGLTVASGRWLVPACDFISPVYAVPLWGALATALAGRRFGLDGSRRGVATIVGAMALVASVGVAMLEPACLKGPYASVDPRLFWLWMDHLIEARSAFALFRDEPAAAAAVLAAPLAALALTPALLFRHADREAAAVVLAALAVAVATALMQVRTLPFAAIFSGPPLAAAAALAVGRFWRFRLDRAWAYALAGFVANPVALTALAAVPAQALAGPGAASDPHAGERLCTRRAEYRALAALPPGLVLNNIAFGPYVLAETPHRVLAAPYHRNRDGILDTVAAFTGPPDTARALLAGRGVDYVAFCATSLELDHLFEPGSDALAAALKRNAPPSWLAPVPDPGGGATRVYRVRRD
jgi:hypothetical protein